MLSTKSYENQFFQLLKAINDDQLELLVSKMSTEDLSRFLWYVEGQVMTRFGNFRKKNHRVK